MLNYLMMMLLVMKVLVDNVFLGSVIFFSAILTYVLAISTFVLVISTFALEIVIAVSSEDFYFGEKILDVCQENDFDFLFYVYDVGGFGAANLIYSWIGVWHLYFLWMRPSSFSGHHHLKN